MADRDGMSPELEQLVSERLQAELQALKIKFSLAFFAVLFALAAASLCWGGLKSKRNKDRRVRRTSDGLAFSERHASTAIKAHPRQQIRHRSASLQHPANAGDQSQLFRLMAGSNSSGTHENMCSVVSDGPHDNMGSMVTDGSGSFWHVDGNHADWRPDGNTWVTRSQSGSQHMEQGVSPAAGRWHTRSCDSHISGEPASPVERSPNDRTQRQSCKASPAVRPQDASSHVLSKNTRENFEDRIINSLPGKPLATEIPTDRRPSRTSSNELPQTNEIPADKRPLRLGSNELSRTTSNEATEILADKKPSRTASNEQVVRPDLGRAGCGLNAPQTPIGRIGNGPIAPIAGAGRKTTDKRDRDERMARIVGYNPEDVNGGSTGSTRKCSLQSASSTVNLASPALPHQEPQRRASCASSNMLQMRGPSSDAPVSPLSALRMRAAADPRQQSQAVINGLATPLRSPEDMYVRGSSVTRASTSPPRSSQVQPARSSGTRFYANVVTKQVSKTVSSADLSSDVTKGEYPAPVAFKRSQPRAANAVSSSPAYSSEYDRDGVIVVLGGQGDQQQQQQQQQPQLRALTQSQSVAEQRSRSFTNSTTKAAKAGGRPRPLHPFRQSRASNGYREMRPDLRPSGTERESERVYSLGKARAYNKRMCIRDALGNKRATCICG